MQTLLHNSLMHMIGTQVTHNLHNSVDQTHEYQSEAVTWCRLYILCGCQRMDADNSMGLQTVQ